MNDRNFTTIESLFERICDEFDDASDNPSAPPSEEAFGDIISDLCDDSTGYLVRVYNPIDESDGYMARPGLKWSDFQDLACPVKKQILLYLVDNPKTFFVLLNTQKGKTAIAAKHFTEWTQLNQTTGAKIVPFMFMMNDRTLADQTQETLNRVPNSKIFQLSTNANTTESEILTHIDAWVGDMYEEYKTPVILTLPNKNQIPKVVRMLDRIKTRVLERGSPLRYAFIIDEFDLVYPLIRDELLPFIECDSALHKLGFISATDGDALDEYPECANAHFESHGEDSPDYRAFHHADSIVKIVDRPPKKHNQFAYKVIEDNVAHFNGPLPNGLIPNRNNSYRKIIVNGDATRASMESFARKMTETGQNYCITINMFGVSLFADGNKRRGKSIRGCRLNAVLFWLYKKERLEDKPLYVIGNRKVDRGLGFHYAPRKNDAGEFDAVVTTFEGVDVVSTNGEGLIFTDLILGRVVKKEMATQKAGRCAGIIAQCPNYCGSVHYWTDQKTANHILNHNRKVDHMNQLSGAYTAQQADTRARSQLAARPAPPSVPTRNYATSPVPHATAEIARAWFRGLNLRREVRRRDGSGATDRVDYTSTSVYHLYRYDDQHALVRCSDTEQNLATHIKYRTSSDGDDGAREIMTLDEFNESTDVGRGLECGRVMPVRVNGAIQYMVIYKNQ